MGLVSVLAALAAFFASFLAIVLRELPYERLFRRRRIAWLFGILGTLLLFQAVAYSIAKGKLGYETGAKRKCVDKLTPLTELDPQRIYHVVTNFNLEYYLIEDDRAGYKLLSHDDLPKEVSQPLWKNTVIVVDTERHLHIVEK